MRINSLYAVLEKLKEKLIANRTYIRTYIQYIKQYRQNCMFQADQKKVYQELNGEILHEDIIPDAEEHVFDKSLDGGKDTSDM